jgi:hypothetical protein
MAHHINLNIYPVGPHQPVGYPKTDNTNGAPMYDIDHGRSMVSNQLHTLSSLLIPDRMLGERPQIQILSTTLLSAFYHLQKSIGGNTQWK